MPTTFARTQITKTPRVQRIVAAGRQLWPDKADSAIIVDLAEEALRLKASPPQRRSASLVLFPDPTGQVLTSSDVAAALLND